MWSYLGSPWTSECFSYFSFLILWGKGGSGLSCTIFCVLLTYGMSGNTSSFVQSVLHRLQSFIICLLNQGGFMHICLLFLLFFIQKHSYFSLVDFQLEFVGLVLHTLYHSLMKWICKIRFFWFQKLKQLI